MISTFQLIVGHDGSELVINVIADDEQIAFLSGALQAGMWRIEHKPLGDPRVLAEGQARRRRLRRKR